LTSPYSQQWRGGEKEIDLDSKLPTEVTGPAIRGELVAVAAGGTDTGLRALGGGTAVSAEVKNGAVGWR
jgi:hypothetical protein